jgi:hypothetical protein
MKPKQRQKRPQTENTPAYIHQYIVKRVGGREQKVAVFVGRKDKSGSIRIGWSRANINAGDKFNREFGLKLALERTKAVTLMELPFSLWKEGHKFAERCHRYFRIT